MDQATLMQLAQMLQAQGGQQPPSAMPPPQGGLSEMMRSNFAARGPGPIMENNHAAPQPMPQRPGSNSLEQQLAAQLSPISGGYGMAQGMADTGAALKAGDAGGAAQSGIPLAMALFPGLKGRLGSFLRGKGEAGPAKPIDPSGDPVGWYMQEKNAGRPPSDQPSSAVVRRDQILAKQQQELDAVAQLKAAERAKLQAEADNATSARMQALQSQTGAVRAATPPAMPPAPPSPPSAPPVQPQAGIPPTQQQQPPPVPSQISQQPPGARYTNADKAITQPAVLDAIRNGQPMPTGGDLAALLRAGGRPEPNMTRLNDRANNAAMMNENMRSAGTPADQAANIMQSNMKAFPKLLPAGAAITAGAMGGAQDEAQAAPDVHPKFKDRDVEGKFIARN